MTAEAERFREVRDAFERLVNEPLEGRESALDAIAMADEALAREVRALLGAHARDASALDDGLAARVLLDEEVPDDWIGRRIGPYRVQRELGRGGMGTVYEATRDDADFDQRVAIKLIRSGVNSESIIRRFRRERQILAALHHPNIATLTDGAMMPDGRPYLVMELVDGEPIDRYADAHRLTIRQRLELFLGVCDAVDHAHRNLVVHRDLKPRNVLVTADGIPKLLDFGIAKLVHSESEDSATLTEPGLRFFTPEYASPEQLRDEAITTRSDIYSLGVILYQLLCGERPFGDAGRGAGDIERILTTDPERPSVAATGSAADARGEADTRALRRRLAGELDNIVLMALRKEPERRYSSVEQFAADLRRYLDGRTVIAQTDTAGYRARKFLGRHRAGVTAAGLILLAMIGGVGATIWQARIAHAEARRAEAERAKSEKVTEFISNILGSASASWTQKGNRVGPQTTVVDALQNATANFAVLAGQPAVEAAVRRTLSNTYLTLGMLDSAERNARLSADLERKANRNPSVDLSKSLVLVAAVLHQEGKYAEAVTIGRQGAEMEQTLGDTMSADRADVLNGLSVIERSAGNLGAADSASAASVALYRRFYGPNSPGLANALVGRSVLLSDRGDLAGAARLLRDVMAIYQAHPEREFPERAILLFNLATAEMWLGDYTSADTLAHQSYDAFIRTVGDRSPNSAMPIARLAYVHHFQGNDTLAEQDARRARALFLKAGMPPNHPELTRVATIEGLILTSLGKLSVADTMLRNALALRMATYKASDMRRPETMIALGVTLAAEGKTVEADSLLRTGESEFARLLGPNDPRAKWAARERAHALSRLSARKSPCSTSGPAQPSCPGTPSERPGSRP